MTPLRKFREEKGIKQITIARELGVAQSLIHRWEKGTQEITPEKAVAIERTFGAKAEDLNTTLKEFITLMKKRRQGKTKQ